MRVVTGCQVNDAIERALRDGADAYEDRGILLVPHFEATCRLATAADVLEQSLYTIFRGLPDRLAPGATLLISTRDRAGGDIELVWEAREEPLPPEVRANPGKLLRHGPYGDLLELALQGLEAFCRVRAAVREDMESEVRSPATYLALAPGVRRRYSFLIPSLRREPEWTPRLD